MNKYVHDGKEVLRITGSAVYGSRSCVHYVDGSVAKSEKYNEFDSLVEKLGFIVHKSREHDRYYGGEMFEAVPPEDPDEWELYPEPCGADRLVFCISGEVRRGTGGKHGAS
jgi:hypothetical protein